MDKQKVFEQLNLIIKLNESMPLFSYIKKHNPSLSWYIEKYGGYQKIKNEMGYKTIIRKSPNYWNNWNNLFKELKKIIIDNKFPTVLQIKSQLGNGAYKSILKFGGLLKVSKLMNCKIHTMLITSDGHHVQSSYEYLVDEFLYKNKIPHEVGGIIHPSKNYRYDFKIGDYYIEIWGYDEKNNRGKKYVEKRIKKEQFYKDVNLKLISIESKLFSEPIKKIELFLKNLILELNFPLIKIKIKNYMNHTKYWNFDTTLKKLKEIIYDIKKFPTTKELKEKKVLYPISKHGGINKFREILGYPRSKPSWTKFEVIKELKMITKQIGHFPKAIELKQMKKNGLLDAITRRHKGLIKIKKDIHEIIL